MTEDLVARIDDFGERAGVANRSQVIRTCVYAVLDDDLKRAMVAQALYDSESLKKIVVGKLLDRFTNAMPAMLEEILAETLEDTAEADAAQ